MTWVRAAGDLVAQFDAEITGAKRVAQQAVGVDPADFREQIAGCRQVRGWE